MWKQETIDLGRVKAKVPVTVSFEYLGNGKYVQSKTSCGCTLADWDEGSSMLKTTYTPGDIAKHLKAMGKDEYNSVKYISVTMVENGNVIGYDLQIKAKIYG